MLPAHATSKAWSASAASSLLWMEWRRFSTWGLTGQLPGRLPLLFSATARASWAGGDRRDMPARRLVCGTRAVLLPPTGAGAASASASCSPARHSRGSRAPRCCCLLAACCGGCGAQAAATGGRASRAPRRAVISPTVSPPSPPLLLSLGLLAAELLLLLLRLLLLLLLLLPSLPAEAASQSPSTLPTGVV